VNLGIAGRVAVVVGSSSGLGYAAAEMLALEGARVLVVSRSEDRVRTAVERIRRSGGAEVAGMALDITDPDGPDKVVRKASEVFGAPTIVVANAGGPPAMPAVEAGADDLEAACRLLVLPVQRLFRATHATMRDGGWGRFIAITSIAVLEPQPGLVLSNALRAAVTGYLKSLADEVAREGITVNSVCPGYTATKRLDQLAGGLAAEKQVEPAEILAGWADQVPIKRLLQPEEVAAAVAFLCSEAASGITGLALPVDGGFRRGLL